MHFNYVCMGQANVNLMLEAFADELLIVMFHDLACIEQAVADFLRLFHHTERTLAQTAKQLVLIDWVCGHNRLPAKMLGNNPAEVLGRKSAGHTA